MLRTRSERVALVAMAVATVLATAPLGAEAPAGVSRERLFPRAARAQMHRVARGMSGGSPPQAPRARSRQVAPRAQRPQGAASSAASPSLVSSQMRLSREESVLQLGFLDGRQVEFAIRDGRMFADGSDLGAAPRGSAGERAWRELLTRAMNAPTPQLAGLLRRWAAPPTDAPLKNALLATLSGSGSKGSAAVSAPAAAAPPAADSFSQIRSELQQMRDSMQQLRAQLRHKAESRDRGRDWSWAGPFRYVWRGITGILSTLLIFAVLLGLGVATVIFGGRPYLEAVAETARRQRARSWLVGLAASFLALPVYIMGTLALVISIIGIPALLVWIPLFPAAVVVGAIFGYLGVAHGAGEALAERRLYGGEWFHRGNSFYFLLTGLGLLLSLFLAAHVVEMAGPWIGFIRGLLMFTAVVATWFAFTTGLGAVLLTRFGTRPSAGMAPPETSSTFEEDAHV